MQERRLGFALDHSPHGTEFLDKLEESHGTRIRRNAKHVNPDFPFGLNRIEPGTAPGVFCPILSATHLPPCLTHGDFLAFLYALVGGRQQEAVS